MKKSGGGVGLGETEGKGSVTCLDLQGGGGRGSKDRGRVTCVHLRLSSLSSVPPNRRSGPRMSRDRVAESDGHRKKG